MLGVPTRRAARIADGQLTQQQEITNRHESKIRTNIEQGFWFVTGPATPGRNYYLESIVKTRESEAVRLFNLICNLARFE